MREKKVNFVEKSFWLLCIFFNYMIITLLFLYELQSSEFNNFVKLIVFQMHQKISLNNYCYFLCVNGKNDEIVEGNSAKSPTNLQIQKKQYYYYLFLFLNGVIILGSCSKTTIKRDDIISVILPRKYHFQELDHQGNICRISSWLIASTVSNNYCYAISCNTVPLTDDYLIH